MNKELRKDRDEWIASSSKFLAAYAATYNLSSEDNVQKLAEFIKFHMDLAYDTGRRDEQCS